jgi:hypothetical protein
MKWREILRNAAQIPLRAVWGLLVFSGLLPQQGRPNLQEASA